MRIANILTAALTIAAAPATASQDVTPTEGAPQAAPGALYCLWVEPVIGSRIETIQCYTREEWADADVDVDKDWATEGVRVIDAANG